MYIICVCILLMQNKANLELYFSPLLWQESGTDVMEVPAERWRFLLRLEAAVAALRRGYERQTQGARHTICDQKGRGRPPLSCLLLSAGGGVPAAAAAGQWLDGGKQLP